MISALQQLYLFCIALTSLALEISLRFHLLLTLFIILRNKKYSIEFCQLPTNLLLIIKSNNRFPHSKHKTSAKKRQLSHYSTTRFLVSLTNHTRRKTHIQNLTFNRSSAFIPLKKCNWYYSWIDAAFPLRWSYFKQWNLIVNISC